MKNRIKLLPVVPGTSLVNIKCILYSVETEEYFWKKGKGIYFLSDSIKDANRFINAAEALTMGEELNMELKKKFRVYTIDKSP